VPSLVKVGDVVVVVETVVVGDVVVVVVVLVDEVPAGTQVSCSDAPSPVWIATDSTQYVRT
jgi:hypothetical protein